MRTPIKPSIGPSSRHGFLIDHGAEIDALDVDHESTPAQYMLRVEQRRHYLRNRQDVAPLPCIPRVQDRPLDGDSAG